MRSVSLSISFLSTPEFSLKNLAIRILMASSVALPAASLCINRRLYQIASGQVVNFGRAEVGA